MTTVILLVVVAAVAWTFVAMSLAHKAAKPLIETEPGTGPTVSTPLPVKGDKPVMPGSAPEQLK